MITEADSVIFEIQRHLNAIKQVFLVADYDDKQSGWIVEDHIHGIQDAINNYVNRDFKASEPDPFA